MTHVAASLQNTSKALLVQDINYFSIHYGSGDNKIAKRAYPSTKPNTRQRYSKTQSLRAKEKEAEETNKKLAQLEAQQHERFKEMEEKMERISKLALKQSFRVIEKEVEANPIPYIEGADKMTAHEVLVEMQKRDCNTWEG